MTDVDAEAVTKRTHKHKPRNLDSKIIKQLDAMAKDLESQEQDLLELTRKLEIVDAKVSPPYFISHTNKHLHICLYWHDLPSEDWQTKCGWRYLGSKYERRGVLPSSLT